MTFGAGFTAASGADGQRLAATRRRPAPHGRDRRQVLVEQLRTDDRTERHALATDAQRRIRLPLPARRRRYSTKRI